MPEVKISFGMIVLNGEPFLRYNLEALYPVAHQIIVVEGASPSAAPHATADGHSLDGTLATLRDFKARSDPDDKLTIVTAELEGHPDGFWSEKEEMSQAYARRATGNYLWQVDVDEFYRPEDMQAVVVLLRSNPALSAVTFQVRTFWGGLDYETDGIALRRSEREFHRLFAWRAGYRYVAHRPPTVVDERGRDLRSLKPMGAADLARRGIYLYHYSFVFPFQVRFKLAYYSPLGATRFIARRQAWADNYFHLRHPFMVDDTSVLGEPSWLLRYTGEQPPAIQKMWRAIERGELAFERRPTADIERLLTNPAYRLASKLLPIAWQPIEWTRRLARRMHARQAGRLLRRLALGIVLLPDLLAVRIRLSMLSYPRTADWATRRWSQQDPARPTSPELAARHAQFDRWYPDDLLPMLRWHGRKSWRALQPEPDLEAPPELADDYGAGTAVLAGKRFFQVCDAATGRQRLAETLQALKPGACLLVYAPHAFAHAIEDGFAWLPSWEDLDELAREVPARVVDFNPGFDRNGFFHFIIQRLELETRAPPLELKASVRQVHYFYLKVGGGRTLGHSAQVLSAAGLNALRDEFGHANDHHYLDRVPEDVDVRADDLAMGHYGNWLTGARQRGARVVLYGPGDRLRPERHDEPYYEQIQQRGSFHEQYLAAHVAIFQAGGLWRTLDPWTYPGLCRWIDLPVSPAVFPWTKRRLAPPGRRVFCFINLYNANAKGGSVARDLARHCPDLSFIAVGCKQQFGLPNVTEYGRVDSRSARYRRLVTQADFLVTPARDDPQPGTVAECAALGLLPILSEYAGYVLSFPRRIDVDDLDQCAATLRAAQAASPEQVADWQALNACYVNSFHRPARCEQLLRRYLGEAVAEYWRMGRDGQHVDVRETVG